MTRLGNALAIPVLMMGFTQAGTLTRPGAEETLVIDMDQGVVVGPPNPLDGPQVGAIILIPQSGRYYRVTASQSAIMGALRAAGREIPDLRTPPKIEVSLEVPPIVVK